MPNTALFLADMTDSLSSWLQANRHRRSRSLKNLSRRRREESTSSAQTAGNFFRFITCETCTARASNRQSGMNKDKRFRIADLLKPHSKLLAVGFLAVAGEAVANLLEPWPL